MSLGDDVSALEEENRLLRIQVRHLQLQLAEALQLTPPTKEVGEFLTESEAADYTRFGKGTMRNWRTQGKGPAFLRVGGAIRYRRVDLDAWLTRAA